MSDRLLGALDRLAATAPERVGVANSSLALFGLWEFSVSSATETSFSGRPTAEDLCPVPDLPDVPLMPGVAGTKIKPAVGSRVLVAFVNGDRSRPHVVAWDQTTAETIGLAGGGAAVHRVGDTSNAGTLLVTGPGLILYTSGDGLTSWAISLTSATAGAPVVVSLVPASGNVGEMRAEAENGSEKVTCG